MFDLLNQAEAAYQKAAHSRMIYQGVNNVISHVYALAVEIKQTGDSKNPQWERYMPQFVDKYDKVVSEIDDLAELLHEDQEQRHWVKQVKKRFKSLQAGIFEVKSSYGAQAEGGVSRGNQQFKVSMQTIFFDPTFVHLLRIGELERKRFEDNSQQEVKLRKNIELVLGAMLTMTVVVSIAFVSIFVRTIGRRLDILKDNATRLASDVELNPQLSPGDELAPLDEVFHVMTAALKESAKKEQALIENAADTICSLTPQLKVIKTNSAAYSLFGVDPDELLGGSLLMQVAPQKREYAREQFEKVIKNSGTAKFDLSHINGENKVREATWSVRWSDEEERKPVLHRARYDGATPS